MRKLRQYDVRAVWMALWIGVFTSGTSPLTFAQQRPRATWLSGARLEKELDRPFSGSWTLVELRPLLADLSGNRHICMVLDRRLDPSHKLTVNANGITLRETLRQIADQSQGQWSVSNRLLYLGPDFAARNVRTLAELRQRELRLKATGIPEPRRSELERRQTIEWEDLESPREILQRVADTANLTIENPELIPHDLWARGEMADITTTEALSFLLIQFDLTFRWKSGGTAVELLSVPERVTLDRRFRPKSKPVDVIDSIRREFPQLDVVSTRAEIVVTGTVEDHEAVARLLDGRQVPPETSASPGPLAKRTFTFSSEQPVPLSTLMKKLEETDIRFDYSVDELKSAGIDLDQLIDVNVNNATVNNFFLSVFGPARLEFQIDGQTVKLKPKKSSEPR